MARATGSVRRTAAVSITIGALAIGLVGCANGDDDTAATAVLDAAPPLAAGPADASGASASGEATTPAGGGIVAGDGTAAEGATTTPPATSPPGETDDRSSGAQPLQASQSIIYTADLAVRVDDIGAASAQAVTLAEAQGGFLVGEQTSFEGRGSSQLVLRVPPAGFRPLLTGLGELGEVLTQLVDAQDVSDRVVDLEARIGAARTSVERLTEFLL
jgi:Domain of unknown function (DUF4349)